MNRTKNAFTLIELLVVIAIIAILAAILFPVFAQAKEAAKQTQSISNAKNMGTALNIYITDYDDTFPNAHSFDTVGQAWRWNFLIQAPVGWRGGAFSTQPRAGEDAGMWHNAMQIYVKNWGVYQVAGAPNATIAAPTVANAIQPVPVGMSYNGLLHSWSATAINAPSSIPLLWSGYGKQNYNGFALSNPALLCNVAGNPSCRYSAGRHPQTGAAGQGGTMFFGNGCGVNSGSIRSAVHQNNAVWVFTDSSARVRRIGMTDAPGNTDFNVDPSTGYRPNGTCPQFFWWDGSHPWLFRPDYQP